MLATGCQNLGRLNRKLSEVLCKVQYNFSASVILLGKFAISVVNTVHAVIAKQLSEPKLLFKRCPLADL